MGRTVYLPASSSRDLFLIPQMEVTFSPLKRSRIKPPQKGHDWEEPGTWYLVDFVGKCWDQWIAKYTNLIYRPMRIRENPWVCFFRVVFFGSPGINLTILMSVSSNNSKPSCLTIFLLTPKPPNKNYLGNLVTNFSSYLKYFILINGGC